MNKLGFICAGMLMLNACATVVPPPDSAARDQASAIKSQGGVYKVGKPYKILGQYYEPCEDYGYSETGIASWYGKDFHAKKTANGEDYDMNTLTAAHRTLPLPSIVKVTNLENGRSLVLRVNDRGPFAKSRIIDISKRGAELLGFQAQGTAKVRVEVLPKESQDLKYALLGDDVDAAPTKGIQKSSDYDSRYLIGAGQTVQGSQVLTSNIVDNGGKKIFVQAGSFAQQQSADRLSGQLQSLGNCTIARANVDGNSFYRVRLGPFSNEDEAKTALNRVKDQGIYNAKIVQD